MLINKVQDKYKEILNEGLGKTYAKILKILFQLNVDI